MATMSSNLPYLLKVTVERLGQGVASLSGQRTAATLQSIAALATVAAVAIAATQFLSAEKLIKDRQSGLVAAAADRCAMMATIMGEVARMDNGSGEFRASLNGMQAGNEFAMDAIPLTEMSSARAVDDLLLCRALTKWYGQATVDLGDRIAMCANAEVLTEAALRLRKESERPRSAKVETSKSVQDRITRCSAQLSPHSEPAPPTGDAR